MAGAGVAAFAGVAVAAGALSTAFAVPQLSAAVPILKAGKEILDNVANRLQTSFASNTGRYQASVASKGLLPLAWGRLLAEPLWP